MSTIEYKFLGIRIQTLSIEILHRYIAEEIKNNNKTIIAHHNLHSLYIFHKNTKMRQFYGKAKYIHIDGMSLVFLGNLLGAHLHPIHRITYVDWIYPLMEEAARRNYRVFFLGSKPGVGAKAAKIFKTKIGGLQIETLPGYFDSSPQSEQNQQVLQKIREYKPHLLLIGMGMPRQEFWILDNLDQIEANVILPAGACMDYIAGEIKTPPRWMGKCGLEWLYRLLTEPKRLWRRYLVEPWFILVLLCGEFIKKITGKSLN